MRIYNEQIYKYVIVLFLVINLIYLKLAKDQRIEIINGMEKASLEQVLDKNLILLEKISDTNEETKLRHRNKHENNNHKKKHKYDYNETHHENEEHIPILNNTIKNDNNCNITHNKNNTQTNSSSDVVSEIGNNIGNGVIPNSLLSSIY